MPIMGLPRQNGGILIIYPYWILNTQYYFITSSEIRLIIYPYWILNNAQITLFGGIGALIIYPYWILNTFPTAGKQTSRRL